MASGPLQTLGEGNYLSLTTFRRDGTPVATPVWVTHEDGHLFVITDAQSGKVKRLRHTGRVRVAACDMRGRVQGPSYPGTAQLLDADASARVADLIVGKYGWQARAFGLVQSGQDLLARLLQRPEPPPRLGIRITLTDQTDQTDQ